MQVFKNLLDPEIAKLLQNGAVGIIPTDTIYGVVCLAANKEAVQRLYELKKREEKPGTLTAADIEQLIALGIKKRYLTAVQHFWPNPISVIIPTGFNLQYLDQGKMSLAIRIPKDKNLIGFLKKSGPLLTSSANKPGETPAATVKEAQKYFGNEIDFYVDGGDLRGHQPSTVIRIVDDAIEVLREGAVKIDEQTGRIFK
jgi:L-threonylcarbamoyladenylate synthase